MEAVCGWVWIFSGIAHSAIPISDPFRQQKFNFKTGQCDFSLKIACSQGPTLALYKGDINFVFYKETRGIDGSSMGVPLFSKGNIIPYLNVARLLE